MEGGSDTENVFMDAEDFQHLLEEGAEDEDKGVENRKGRNKRNKRKRF